MKTHSQKFHCIYCGDSFALGSEDLELFQEGYLNAPDTCPDCQENLDCPDFEFMDHSDADPGL